MKTNNLTARGAAAIFATALSFGTWAVAADNTATPPAPGTVQSTDTKTSSAQNNTPRTNPNPNPDPASQAPAGQGQPSTCNNH